MTCWTFLGRTDRHLVTSRKTTYLSEVAITVQSSDFAAFIMYGSVLHDPARKTEAEPNVSTKRTEAGLHVS